MVLVYNFVKTETYKSVVIREDKLLTLDILSICFLPSSWMHLDKTIIVGKKIHGNNITKLYHACLPKEGRENKVVKQIRTLQFK